MQRTREALWHLMSRQLDDLRLAVVMLNGIEIKGPHERRRVGITTAGDKPALGLWPAARRTPPSRALLSDVVSRGLDIEQRLLYVIDGSNAPDHVAATCDEL